MKPYHGMKKIGNVLDSITRPAFMKYGFANQKIINYWPEIVGSALAKFTLPQKIVFPPGQTRGGILHIGVRNPGLCLEIQAQESHIVEKVATFFGYQAVSRIKVIVIRFSSLLMEAEPAPKQEISSGEHADLEATLVKIKDEELRLRLRALAESLFKKKEDC